MVSIFFRFQESSHAAWLAMSRGVEERSVSTIRSLFARREAQLSVTSTIASTSSCAFTSVAPQENSTSAFTLLRRRYFLVRLTTSVAIRFPCKSLTDLMREFSGTAKTQRVGWLDTLLNWNSPTSWTFELFS